MSEKSETNLLHSIYIDHHLKSGACFDRPPYRDGKRKTAIKAYNVSQESTYLAIHGVPELKLKNEIKRLCERYGPVEKITNLESTLSPQFTEAFLVKMENLSNARFAKRKLDDMTFFGGCLQVTFAAEFETVADCRLKLYERFKLVKNQLRLQDQSKTRRIAVTSGSSSSSNAVNISTSSTWLPQLPEPTITLEMPKFSATIDGERYSVVDLYSIDFTVYEEPPCLTAAHKQMLEVVASTSSQFSQSDLPLPVYPSILGKDYKGLSEAAVEKEQATTSSSSSTTFPTLKRPAPSAAPPRFVPRQKLLKKMNK